MIKLGIIGANGFIGTRAVEAFHLGKFCRVIPVVRQFQSLARLSRFSLDWRIADATDEASLAAALTECDAVLCATVGNTDHIVGSAAAIYHAACRSGVKRLIYLSSAAVHGQCPALGSDETSPLSTSQPLEYNNAKVRAEARLQRLREKGDCEIVILRPGIVYGPRSRWTAGIADQILTGTACLVEDGKGICNSIYVDNLLEAIKLALTASNVDRQCFLVGDRETVTWQDLYAPIAQAMGRQSSDIPRWHGPIDRQLTAFDVGAKARAAAPVQAILPLFPDRLKRSAKAALQTFFSEPEYSPWMPPQKQVFVKPDLETFTLQQCRYKLPFDKAERILGYNPKIAFEEGCRRSIAWLKFAGYPVVTSNF